VVIVRRRRGRGRRISSLDGIGVCPLLLLLTAPEQDREKPQAFEITIVDR
jgi:hypothetical protein